MYPVGPGLGPTVAAFRQSGGYAADITGTVLSWYDLYSSPEGNWW
jgi:hypothetical protein